MQLEAAAEWLRPYFRPFPGTRGDGSPGFEERPRKKKCIPPVMARRASTTPIQ
jgi:hypothetical protein